MNTDGLLFEVRVLRSHEFRMTRKNSKRSRPHERGIHLNENHFHLPHCRPRLDCLRAEGLRRRARQARTHRLRVPCRPKTPPSTTTEPRPSTKAAGPTPSTSSTRSSSSAADAQKALSTGEPTPKTRKASQPAPSAPAPNSAAPIPRATGSTSAALSRSKSAATAASPCPPQAEQDEDLKLLALNAIMQQDESHAIPAIQQILNRQQLRASSRSAPSSSSRRATPSKPRTSSARSLAANQTPPFRSKPSTCYPYAASNPPISLPTSTSTPAMRP